MSFDDLGALALVSMASMAAGFFDSIVGGGGLILTPALFAIFPSAQPVSLLAMNKSASVWGTALATTQYARRVNMPWRSLWPAALLAGLGSLSGAWVLGWVSSQYLRQVLPFVLLALLIYTLLKKDLGQNHQPKFTGQHQTLGLCAMGLVIGFYDGFFGPGTGSFLIFAMVRVFGFDFLHASASAKLINLATNSCALALFTWQGHIQWRYALVLAVANVLGSWLGSRMSLKHGTSFVRWMFIVVVAALMCKTGFDAFFKN
jgi:uncharacterized protein